MLRTLLYVLYFVLVLVLVRMVSRSLGRLFGVPGAGRPSGGTGRAGPRGAEDLVRDRICNTHVPRSRALTAVIEGREEHFCSEACRARARTSVPRAS